MTLLGKLFGSLRSVAKKIFSSPANLRHEACNVSDIMTEDAAQKLLPEDKSDTHHKSEESKGTKKIENPLVDKKTSHKHAFPPLHQEKLWEYKGVSKTAKEWAAQYGVTVNAMRYRLNTTGSPEYPGGGNIKSQELYESNGKIQSILEWAKEFGVSEHAIRWRIKKYGGVEIKSDDSCFAEFKDIKFIEQEGRKKIEADGKIYSLQQFCKEFGISFGTFYGRVCRGLDIKDVIKSIRKVNRDYKTTPPVKAKLWEWKGEKHTVSEWADKYGVKTAMMRKRLTEHGSPERNTEKRDTYLAQKREQSKQWEWKGETHSIKEWAEIYKCPERTMYGRFARSGSPEPLDKGPKIWEWNGEKHTTGEWAKIVGKSESAMRARLQTHGNPYCVPAKGVRKKVIPKNSICGVEKSYTWNGETKKSSEWAKEYNCSVNAIRKRFRVNGSPEVKSKEQLSSERSHKFTWNGETLTYKEWGSRYGISGESMRVRIKRNGTPEPKIERRDSALIPIPEDKTKDKTKEDTSNVLYGYNGDWKTLREWAEEYSIPEWKIKNNFVNFGCPCVSDMEEESESVLHRRNRTIGKIKIKRAETGQRQESIKEWLERIRKEEDDGRPLREILGIPKEDMPHLLDHLDLPIY